MKYKDRDDLVQGLRDLADFLERPESIALPMDRYSPFRLREFLWNDNSKEEMKGIVKILGSCKKNYSSSTLSVTKSFGKTVELEYETTRENVCTRRVVETKQVPKKRYVEIPNEFDTEEVVEWDCDPLLAPTE